MAPRLGQPSATPRSARRRGAILLEAVLSLTLFLLGAALIGGAVRAGLAAAERISSRTRGLALAESLLAEIRADYLIAEDGAESDFAPQFPDYRYHLSVTEDPNLPALRTIVVTVMWDVPADFGQPERTETIELVGWQFYQEPPEQPDDGEAPLEEESPFGDGELPAPGGSGGGGPGGGGGGGGP